jgi:hypothetical protein
MLLASVTPVIFCGVQKEEQICVCNSACMAPQRKQVAFTVAAEAPNKPSQLVQGKMYPQNVMCVKGSAILPPQHISLRLSKVHKLQSQSVVNKIRIKLKVNAFGKDGRHY